ncbi:MAG TPA: anthranilate phosphoribosyltransferase [Polyangiaceae bacterium]|jgi:anthranilate phosphoribosyltransferase
MTVPFRAAITGLLSGEGPTPESVRGAFGSILAGVWTPVQVGAYVVALRQNGESPEVIAAAARAMRDAMVRVEHGFPRLLDTCGTGGDGSESLNLSTGAAIIAAACGAPVAKHGNRAATSRAGSADVLEALGVRLDVPPERAADVLTEANIVFMPAQAHHPAMRHAAQARKELGVRTIFNCLGPLANPAGATHQLVGAYADSLRSVMAETLASLGTERAWVVHGEDALDEVSPCAPTRVTVLAGGKLDETVVTPEDFGLPRLEREAIRGGDPAFNADVLARVLRGEAHPAADAFVLNAAAALVVFDGDAPRDAARRARAALASGKAYATLEALRAATAKIH